MMRRMELEEAFDFFKYKLNEKEQENVYCLLGLSNSDIELGEGKEIIADIINANEIEQTCKEAGVLWDKESIGYSSTLKNGIEIQRSTSKLSSGTIVSCPKCEEYRFYRGRRDGSYKCLVCGYYVEPAPRNNRSMGEILLEEILIKNNIVYQREVREFKAYRYDFVAYIGDMKFYLEVHGNQHFEPVEYFGGYDAWLRLQKSDKEKMKYAQENGIYIMFDYSKNNLKILREEINEKFINKYLKQKNGGIIDGTNNTKIHR